MDKIEQSLVIADHIGRPIRKVEGMLIGEGKVQKGSWGLWFLPLDAEDYD